MSSADKVYRPRMSGLKKSPKKGLNLPRSRPSGLISIAFFDGPLVRVCLSRYLLVLIWPKAHFVSLVLRMRSVMSGSKALAAKSLKSLNTNMSVKMSCPKRTNALGFCFVSFVKELEFFLRTSALPGFKSFLFSVAAICACPCVVLPVSAAALETPSNSSMTKRAGRCIRFIT